MKTIDSYRFVNVRAGNGVRVSRKHARRTKPAVEFFAAGFVLMPDETLSAPNAPLNQSPSRAAQVLTRLAKARRLEPERTLCGLVSNAVGRQRRVCSLKRSHRVLGIFSKLPIRTALNWEACRDKLFLKSLHIIALGEVTKHARSRFLHVLEPKMQVVVVSASVMRQ